jgi:hypothetical protein
LFPHAKSLFPEWEEAFGFYGGNKWLHPEGFFWVPIT